MFARYRGNPLALGDQARVSPLVAFAMTVGKTKGADLTMDMPGTSCQLNGSPG